MDVFGLGGVCAIDLNLGVLDVPSIKRVFGLYEDGVVTYPSREHLNKLLACSGSTDEAILVIPLHDKQIFTVTWKMLQIHCLRQ